MLFENMQLPNTEQHRVIRFPHLKCHGSEIGMRLNKGALKEIRAFEQFYIFYSLEVQLKDLLLKRFS